MSLFAGPSYSILIDSDGFAWAFGDNTERKLGLVFEEISFNPEKVPTIPTCLAVSGGISHTCYLDTTGAIWTCGNNRSYQLGLYHQVEKNEGIPLTQVDKLPDIQAISCGHYFTILLDTHGKVWSCGKYRDW